MQVIAFLIGIAIIKIISLIVAGMSLACGFYLFKKLLEKENKNE